MSKRSIKVASLLGALIFLQTKTWAAPSEPAPLLLEISQRGGQSISWKATNQGAKPLYLFAAPGTSGDIKHHSHSKSQLRQDKQGNTILSYAGKTLTWCAIRLEPKGVLMGSILVNQGLIEPFPFNVSILPIHSFQLQLGFFKASDVPETEWFNNAIQIESFDVQVNELTGDAQRIVKQEKQDCLALRLTSNYWKKQQVVNSNKIQYNYHQILTKDQILETAGLLGTKLTPKVKMRLTTWGMAEEKELQSKEQTFQQPFVSEDLVWILDLDMGQTEIPDPLNPQKTMHRKLIVYDAHDARKVLILTMSKHGNSLETIGFPLGKTK